LSAGNTPFIGSNRLHICLCGGGAEEEEEEEDKDKKCKEQMKKQNTGFWFKSYPNKKKRVPLLAPSCKKTKCKNSHEKN
jgi:hypothetical protein